MPDGEWDYKLHRQLAELGAAMGPAVREPTLAIYTPMHPEEPPYEVLRDFSYGPHERNRLDVHLPPRGEGSRPVLIFVHGGGFTGGDKRRVGEPFYDNIGHFAVNSGFVGVTMTYRLAPEFTYPSGAEDVAAAVRWVQANISQYSGNPTHVVVMGHSAGSGHVASFVASPELLATLEHRPAGAILSSGVYDPTVGEGAYATYYGDDASLLAERAAIPGLVTTDVPLLVSTAELDPPDIQIQTRRLLDALFDARGRFPEMVQAQGHNHFSAMLHIATNETWFTDRLARFVEGVGSND